MCVVQDESDAELPGTKASEIFSCVPNCDKYNFLVVMRKANNSCSSFDLYVNGVRDSKKEAVAIHGLPNMKKALQHSLDGSVTASVTKRQWRNDAVDCNLLFTFTVAKEVPKKAPVRN